MVFLRLLLALGVSAASLAGGAGFPRTVNSCAPAPSVVRGIPQALHARDTVRVEDDLGRTLTLPASARRIVSLVPAATEILFAIDAGDQVVGRTRFDEHPSAVLRVPSVGDGIRPSAELVLERRPDVVIVFAGPDNRASIAELERLGLPVLAVYHNSLADLFRNMRRLGTLAGREAAADRLARRLHRQLDAIASLTRSWRRVRVYYDVWADPPITIGRGSYLDSLITLAGGRNVFGDVPEPSPQVSLEAIVARQPELLLLPVDRGVARLPPAERPGWNAVTAVRSGRVREVDAGLLERLGPRSGEAAAALAAAIHPEAAAALATLMSSSGADGS